MSARLFRARHVETNDDGELQTVNLRGLPRESLEGVHRIQPFGFHSNIPKGSHGFGLQFGASDGSRLLNAFLGGEHPEFRPRKRDVGSTALYDANGNLISLVQKELRVTGKAATVIEGKDHTTVRLTDGTEVILKDGKVYLGGMQGAQAVMTAGGQSSRVFAVI
ncbi:phage baseplate assembly protein domain-containing protein [Methylobacterium fujisawaense]|uniref:phage baseplate assembly protein domain-containing protein n=1 Tax=Methylobacterium fujisawaense TaxID=107400 RepID=UPI00313D1DB7